VTRHRLDAGVHFPIQEWVECESNLPQAQAQGGSPSIFIPIPSGFPREDGNTQNVYNFFWSVKIIFIGLSFNSVRILWLASHPKKKSSLHLL
jgi:hypothetical protein